MRMHEEIRLDVELAGGSPATRSLALSAEPQTRRLPIEPQTQRRRMDGGAGGWAACRCFCPPDSFTPFSPMKVWWLCVVQDTNMGHQLAGYNISWCPELESRTTCSETSG